MARLVGFFVLVLIVLQVLRRVPIVGALFQVPLLGFWLSAILVSVLGSKLAADWLDRRKQRALERQLGTVDTPHNLGKLGSLLLAQRRYRRALGYLGRAIQGEPGAPEWRYRAGCALLGLRHHGEAARELELCAAADEEYAYGAVLLRLAEALQGAGDFERALATLERFERNHGPNPESAYRRGLALAKLARRDEARAAFAEVGDLARGLAAYQRRGALGWVARAFLARFA